LRFRFESSSPPLLVHGSLVHGFGPWKKNFRIIELNIEINEIQSSFDAEALMQGVREIKPGMGEYALMNCRADGYLFSGEFSLHSVTVPYTRAGVPGLWMMMVMYSSWRFP
jgi:hypothetical protein